MGKIRSFLGLFVSLFIMFFAANAFADYSCLQNMVYTECKKGYWLDNGQCKSCNTERVGQDRLIKAFYGDRINDFYYVNNADDLDKQEKIYDDNGQLIGRRYRTCDGYYTGGKGGAAGISDCTGCSWEYQTCECNTGYKSTIVPNLNGSVSPIAPGVNNYDGSTCTCVKSCDTAKACSDLGAGYTGTYDECTGNQATACSKTCTVPCSGQVACPANATCTYNTGATVSGKQFYGSNECKNDSGAVITAPLCQLLTTTCKSGYHSVDGACVAWNYLITYNNGGGQGDAQSQWVAFDSNFSTKPADTFTKPGFSFTTWTDSENNETYSAGATQQYTNPGGITLTATWAACPASSVAGQCNCPADQRPNGTDGCSNCAVQCTDSVFNQGTYNECSGQTSDICYRACTSADITDANATAVGGTLTKAGTNACVITACAAGYEPSTDGKSCVAKTYTIRYIYGAMSKTKTVKFGEKFTTLSATEFIKPGSTYANWTCSAAAESTLCPDGHITAATEYTYNYPGNLTLNPKWDACPASSELGQCNCSANTSPNGQGSCTGWTACADTHPEYPNGEYNNDTGSSEDSAGARCYRDCTTSDVTDTNATAVAGGVYMMTDGCTITECKTGYTPAAGGKSCVANTYTLTYKAGAGVGDDIAERIQYMSNFTIKTAKDLQFYKPGYSFSTWKTVPTTFTPFIAGKEKTYNKTMDATATAQWTACAANPDAYSASDADNCACGDGMYPNGGGCNNCVVQCNDEYYVPMGQDQRLPDLVGEFTNGSFNVCQAEGYSNCYRDCVASDIVHATTVVGKRYKSEAYSDCKVLTCEKGYSPAADLKSCELDKYNVTFIAGATDAYLNPAHDISANPLTITVGYDEKFTLLNNAVFLRPGKRYTQWVYTGSSISMTAGGQSRNYTYMTNKTIEPKWLNCAADPRNPGTCACAADEYPDGNGACTNCQTACSVWNSSFPIGTYNACSDDVADAPVRFCGRACTPADIEHAYVPNSGEADSVTGVVYADNNDFDVGQHNTCKVYQCNLGYKPSPDNTYCQSADFTVTYDPNGANGSAFTRSVSYTGTMTVASPDASWQNPGKRFTVWNTDTAGTGTSYTAGTSSAYNRADDLKLYAQWENCPASSVAGECGCPSTQRPDGNGGCTSCTVACSTIAGTEYTIGNYNQCAGNQATMCKRNCTTDDIAHSADVMGTIAATGANTCKVNICESGYEPSSGNLTCVERAGVCDDGMYHNGAACVLCPVGFDHSDGQRTSEADCYKESTTLCINPGKGNGCPVNARTCTYIDNDTTRVPCIQHNDGSSTCTPIGTGQCPYATVTCNSPYYSTGTECVACSTLGSTWAQKSDGSKGPEACYSLCNYDCANDMETLKPAHAQSCQLVSAAISGNIRYPATSCALLTGRYCSVNNCTCETGYTYHAPTTSTQGDNGECVANVYTVTLNDNGGAGGSGTVYEKYATGWSRTEGFDDTVSRVTIPTWENHTFNGYFNTATPTIGMNPVIPATGILPAATTLTAHTELYANWTEDVFICTAGQTATGKTCPAGSYCPGEAVPAAQATDTVYGCQRTCPADTAGGQVTSAAGSQVIGACKSTRTIAKDDEKHGSADQTCAYTTNAYDSGCSIKMTACYEGYYLANTTDTSCTITEVGQYSAVNDLEPRACSALSGADATVTTADRGAKSPMECYNTCAVKGITNGSHVPVNDKEFYTGTTIPACTFTTKCNTGYVANGEVCDAKVYTITLDNGDGVTPKTGTIYLKYGDGWYSDKAATKRITQVELPVKSGGFTCYGYAYGNTQVVDANKNLTTNYTLFTNDATINASWEQNASVTCAAGEYYTGTGTSCAPCAAGDYCEGITTFQDTNEVAGRKSCADLNGTYTAARDAAGQALTVTVTSAPRAKAATACYATNVAYAPASNLGAGRQTCKYNASTGKYTDECTDKELFTCVAGHWRKNAADVDCVPVGSGYYSPATTMARTACPNLGEVDGITSSDTAEDVTKCKLGNIWYAPTGGHSGHRRACYHIPNAAETNVSRGYDYNCDASKLVTCDAGYYYDGSHTIVADGRNVADCVPVTDGWYSPAPTGQPNFEDTVLPSTVRTRCPNDGQTGKSTASVATECYQVCSNKKITNGNAIVPTGKDKVYYTGTEYPACVYNAQCDSGFTPGSTTPTANPVCGGCPENSYCTSDGQTHSCPTAFPKSDAGATKEGDCYRACVATGNVAAVTGREYAGGNNTCTVTACKDGAYLTNGKCEVCPVGYICGSDGKVPCPAGSYCPAGADKPTACPASHPSSAEASAKQSDCYKTCEQYDIIGGTAIPKSDKAYYNTTCTFEGRSDSGNPCAIVNNVCTELSCNSDYELIDGKCQKCVRENVLSYKTTGNCIPASCVSGYHPNGLVCEEDVKECEMPNAISATQEWNTKLGAFSVCTIRECDSGYHLASNTCVADEQPCVVDHGTGVKEWNHASNTWGACVATSCDPGYTDDPSETNERNKQCGQCKNKFSVLGEQAVSSYVSGCEIASCLYQGELYNLENNECVPICEVNKYEDETGTRVWDASRKKCIRTCKEGYSMW